MKSHLITTITALGLAVLGLAATACSSMEPTGTHRMGPPHRSMPMSDAVMPSRAE